MINLKKLPKIGTQVWVYFFNPNGKRSDRTPTASVQERTFEGIATVSGDTFCVCRKDGWDFSMTWHPERVSLNRAEAEIALNRAIDNHIETLKSLYIR